MQTPQRKPGKYTGVKPDPNLTPAKYRELQAKLEKLKKAEGKIKDDTTISVQEKEETLAHIKEYRFILTDLLKESKQCANELAQVERLQRQKREQFEIFHHFREIGQKRLEEFSSL